MSKSINSITLLGYVGKDAKQYGEGMKKCVTFSVATTHAKKEGDKYVDVTEWHQIVSFGKLADSLIDKVHSGSQICVVGRLTYSTNPNTGTKYTQIFANECIVLGKHEKTEKQDSEPSPSLYKTFDDERTMNDIPF